MNKYDTIKEVFEWPLLEDYNTKKFYAAQGSKGQRIWVCKPQLLIPGLSRITLDETAGREQAGEVTLEYSAKILGPRYPDLISIDTIEEAHANIVRTDLITFDVNKVIANAVALKIHQTFDFRLPLPLPAYGKALSKLWIPNGYLLRNQARGKSEWQSFSFLREIQTNPEYLKFYNKLREFLLSKNRGFRDSLTLAEQNEMARRFTGVTRAELCVVGKRKIRQHFPDVGAEGLLIDVLRSKVNALGNLHAKNTAALTSDDDVNRTVDFADSLSCYKEFQMFSVLAMARFDFDKACALIKSRRKDSTYYEDKKKYKALLGRYLSHQSGGDTAELLHELRQAVAGL